MSLGTLSEKRTATTPIDADYAVPEGNQPILKTMVAPTTQENKPPIKEPLVIVQAPKTPVKEPKTEHVQDTKCAYCKAEAITTLAIRGSIVLVLLALCFNLIKSASK